MSKISSDISKRRKIILIAILGIAIFISYSQSLFNGFFYDDRNLIIENPLVVNHKFIDIWRTDLFESTRGSSQYYRPVLVTIFTLEHLVFRDNAAFYHLTNIILHFLCALILLKLAENILKKLNIDKKHAFFAAFLFALHPVNSQSVYWICARGDILATIGIITGILCFVSKKKLSYIFLPLVFALTILSKETGLLFLILLPLYLIFIKGDLTKRDIIIKFAVLIPVLIVYFVVRMNIVKSGYVFNSEETFWNPADGHFNRLMTVFPIWGYYLLRAFFPFFLNFETGIKMFSYFKHWQFLLGFISVVLTVIAVIALRKNKFFLWAFLFWIISLFPVLNIFPIFESGMEHYIYLPMVAFCIFIGLVFRKNKITIFSFVVLCVAFSMTIFIRGFDWRSEICLWKDSANKTAIYARHGWIRSRVNLASSYITRSIEETGFENDINTAESLYHIVQKEYPDFNEVNIGLGNIALIKGDYQTALTYISEAVRENPGNYFLLNKLAYIYSALEQHALAKQIILDIIEMKPDYDEANANLAVIYFIENNFERSYQKFLNTDITPRNYVTMKILEISFSVLHGEKLTNFEPEMISAVNLLDAAKLYYEKAELLNFISSKIPNDPDIFYSLTLCRTLDLNDGDVGIEIFIEGIEKFPGDPRFYKGLGLLYLSLNDTAKSVLVFKEFLIKFPDDSTAVNVQNFIKSLEM